MKRRYYVQLHLIETCNLSCIHCYQEGSDYLDQLDYEECKRVFNEIEEVVKQREEVLQEELIPQIQLTGGEPLLYSKLFEVIDEIRRRGWLWALLTNGTLIDHNIAEKIKERAPVFVQVSLEGGKQMNDLIRGEGCYERVLQGITTLKREKIKVLVSFTINAMNWREFTEVAKICRQYHVDKLWCDRYVGKDSLTISTEEFKQFLGLLRKEMKRPRILYHTKIKGERSLQFLCQGKMDHLYQCGAGGDLLVITAKGEVLPCRRLPLVLGNIREHTISEILSESIVWKELSTHHVPDQCIGCRYDKVCRGGAKCITYAQTGNFRLNDVNCWMTAGDS